jgi:ribosomal protein S18 acetylase RimI-like enzyme
MNAETHILTAADADKFIELINVFAAVFDMKPFELPDSQYLQQLLQRDSFFVVVALAGKRVVGGLTAYTLPQYYCMKPLVYLYDLAVSPDFQRQGIGRQLLRHLNEHCRQIGAEEVFVQADRVDQHALDFYRSTGGNEEDVVHFTYPLL